MTRFVRRWALFAATALAAVVLVAVVPRRGDGPDGAVDPGGAPVSPSVTRLIAETESAPSAPVRESVESELASRELALEVVRWPDGKPIPDAALVLRERQSRRTVDLVLTDAQGRALVHAPAGNTSVQLEMEAAAPGYSTAVRAVTDDSDVIRLALEPEYGWIGRVVDAQGAAVSGAEVAAFLSVQLPRRPRMQRTQESTLPPVHFDVFTDLLEVADPTNAEGWYFVGPYIADGPGEIAILASKDAHAIGCLRQRLPLPGTRLEDVRQVDHGWVTGRVVGTDGRPVEGIELRTAIGGEPSQPGRRDVSLPIARTALDGTFHVPRLCDSQVLVVDLSSHELISSVPEATHVGIPIPDGEDNELWLVLAEIRRVVMKISDRETRASIAGARCSVHYTHLGTKRTMGISARSDETGSAVLRVPVDLDGPARVEITAPGYAPHRWNLTPAAGAASDDDEHGVDLVPLEGSFPARVRVTDERGPVAGASVYLFRSEDPEFDGPLRVVVLTSGEAGCLSFRVPRHSSSQEKYSLIAVDVRGHSPLASLRSAGRTVSYEETPEEEIELYLEAPRTLSATVSGFEPTSRVGVELRVDRIDGFPLHRVLSAEVLPSSGEAPAQVRFRLPAVLRGTVHSFDLTAPGAPTAGPVPIPEGAEELVLRRIEPTRLTVQVGGLGAEDATEYFTTLFAEGEADVRPLTRPLDRKGRAEFDHVPPGRYDVVVARRPGAGARFALGIVRTTTDVLVGDETLWLDVENGSLHR